MSGTRTFTLTLVTGERVTLTDPFIAGSGIAGDVDGVTRRFPHARITHVAEHVPYPALMPIPGRLYRIGKGVRVYRCMTATDSMAMLTWRTPGAQGLRNRAMVRADFHRLKPA